MRRTTANRKLRILGVVIASVLVASACTSNGESGGTTDAAGTDTTGRSGSGTTAAPGSTLAVDDRTGVVLKFGTWTAGAFQRENYDLFITEFVEMDPRVDAVEISFHPFTRYTDVLNVEIAAGDPPDVMWMPATLLPAYAAPGHLLDLTDHLARIEGYEFDDLRESALAPWRQGDALYGVPFTNSPNVMYVNLDIFEAAGLPNPEEIVAAGEWTWDYVREAAKQIVDTGAADYGFHFRNNLYTNGWRILEDIYAPYGVQPWSEDGQACQFTSPEAVAATQMVWDMIYVDESHPGPGVESDWFAGDIGMALARPSQASRLEDGAPFEWTIVRHPSGPEGYRPAIGHAGLSVYAASENADIAAEFLAFITNPQHSIDMGAAFPSARASLQTSDLLGPVNPVLSADQIDNAIITALSSPDASWGYSHINFGPVFNNAQTVFDGEVWTPDADVPAALANICNSIEALLG